MSGAGAVSIIAAVLEEVAEHADVIELALSALRGGVSKDDLKDSIKRQMTMLSDAQIAAELAPSTRSGQ